MSRAADSEVKAIEILSLGHRLGTLVILCLSMQDCNKLVLAVVSPVRMCTILPWQSHEAIIQVIQEGAEGILGSHLHTVMKVHARSFSRLSLS